MIIHVYGHGYCSDCTQHLLVGYFAVMRSFVPSSLLQHTGGGPGCQSLDINHKPPIYSILTEDTVKIDLFR